MYFTNNLLIGAEMAKFLNIDPSPKEQEITSKASKGAPATQAPKPLDWDDTSDHDLNAQARASNIALATADTITKQESITAGTEMSLIGTAFRKATSPVFEDDPTFNVVSTLQNDPVTQGMQLSEEEVKYLRESGSVQEYQYRTQEVRAERERIQVFGANPISGFSGAILGDAPTLLLPYAAAGVGSKAFALRNVIRVADVGTAFYAQDQLGQSSAVTAVIGAVSGIDAFFDARRVQKAVRLAGSVRDTVQSTVQGATVGAEKVRTKPSVFDTDAPTSPAGVNGTASTVRAKELHTPLKEPVVVGAGKVGGVQVKGSDLVKHLLKSADSTASNKAILRALSPAIKDLDVTLSTNTAIRSNYKMSVQGADVVRDSLTLRAAKSADSKVWNSASDALNSIDKGTGAVAVHELIHAATAGIVHKVRQGVFKEGTKEYKAVQDLETLCSTLKQVAGSKFKYQLSSVDEMLAALGDTPKFVKFLDSVPYKGNETGLRALARTVLNALGITKKGSALEKILDDTETLFRSKANLDTPSMRSRTMQEATKDLDTTNDVVLAESMLKGVREKLAQSFALYDNIKQGSKELADKLVADGSSTAGRKPSVADYKRNLELEFTARAVEVEDAITKTLRSNGVGRFDMFFNRAKFTQAREVLEGKVTRYLDAAYDAEVRGVKVPDVPSDIADVIQAFRNSKWSEAWHDTVTKSGMVDPDAFLKSSHYLPRRYSGKKISDMYNSGWTRSEIVKGFRMVLKDTYPSMDADTLSKVSESMLRGIEQGGLNSNNWRSMISSLSDDELIMAMRNAGIEDSKIQSFLARNQQAQTGLGSSSTMFKSRARFNMNKEYSIGGKSFKMQDIMETNVSSLMQGYTNRMSGRVGMQMAGIKSLTDLAKEIDAAALRVPARDKWVKTMDDTVTHLLGGFSGDQAPELMRAAGNFASATMLKNSGLYQITDIALGMKEFGMGRVLRSMVKEPWFKQVKVIGDSKDMSERLNSILRGSIQKDMKFRWLHTYADDNYDLTTASSLFNASINVGQGARMANGMYHIHRMQVNLYSGLIADELKTMLRGDAGAIKRLERFGLEPSEARAMSTTFRKQGNSEVLPWDMQRRLEVVGVRAMDYVVQNIRTGETSAFAQFSGIGKIVVGYQSFVLAATNKILRRYTSTNDYAGLAMLMAHQYPLLLLLTAAKYGMDGNTSDKSTRDWIAESVAGMSALGGISMLQDIFMGDSPRHSIPSLSFIANSVGTLQKVLETGDITPQDVSRIVPYVQEFAVTRALINNFGD